MSVKIEALHPDLAKLLQYLSQIWPNYCNISARFDQFTAISQADLALFLSALAWLDGNVQRIPNKTFAQKRIGR